MHRMRPKQHRRLSLLCDVRPQPPPPRCLRFVRYQSSLPSCSTFHLQSFPTVTAVSHHVPLTHDLLWRSPSATLSLPLSHLSAFAESSAESGRPRHSGAGDVWREVKDILSNFIKGSKQLYHNALRSRRIKQQSAAARSRLPSPLSRSTSLTSPFSPLLCAHRRLRAEPSLILARADHRHLRQTRVDLLGGAFIAAAFWIPVVGNVIPLLAHFFPRQLPSVFVTIERKHQIIQEDAQVGLPILLQLQRAISSLPPSVSDQTAQAETASAVANIAAMPAPRSEQSVSSSSAPSSALFHVRQPDELLEYSALFQSLPLSAFAGSHLHHLLRFHANLLLLHSLLPAALLARHLQHWAASVLHDDGMLRREDRGGSLTVAELTDALHERGLYQGLMSREYRAWVQRRVAKKRGEKVRQWEGTGEEEDEEEQLRQLLIRELQGWLELSVSHDAKDGSEQRQLPVSLLCHAGPLLYADETLKHTRRYA